MSGYDGDAARCDEADEGARAAAADRGARPGASAGGRAARRAAGARARGRGVGAARGRRARAQPRSGNFERRRKECADPNRISARTWLVAASCPRPDLFAPPSGPGPADAQVIALANQKGGVAKTTTTLNLGVAFARAGARRALHRPRPAGQPDDVAGPEPGHDRALDVRRARAPAADRAGDRDARDRHRGRVDRPRRRRAGARRARSAASARSRRRSRRSGIATTTS